MQTNLHLCAYSSSIANTGSNNQVSAVNDAILTILSNNFVVPKKAEVVMVAGFGANMTRLRLNTPKFRNPGLPSVVPINASATVPSPTNAYINNEYPFVVDPVDQIQMESTNGGGGAEQHWVVMLLRFARQMIPPAPVFRLRGTAAITAVANSWANGAITMDQALPQGHYVVTNMDVVGTNLIGARLIFPGSSFRPGTVCRNSVGGFNHPALQNPTFGVLGDFDNINLPNLEIFAAGANSAQEVFLDLIRTGDATGVS